MTSSEHGPNSSLSSFAHVFPIPYSVLARLIGKLHWYAVVERYFASLVLRQYRDLNLSERLWKGRM